MARRRGNPVAKAGNYMQEVDPVGVDPAMGGLLFGTPMDKTESAYVKGKGNSASSIEAVRRARKANKKPPLNAPV